MTSVHSFWLAGRPAEGDSTLEVTSPWDSRYRNGFCADRRTG